jgi:hypothetical protein
VTGAAESVVLWQTSGRVVGRRAFLRQGETLLVGRASGGVVVRDDPRLAARHARIEWRGRVPWLCALDGETAVDGVGCREAALADGSWVRAGSTDFVVLRGAAPPSRAAEHPAAARALELLREGSEPLFAVVDGARDPRVVDLLRRAPDEHASLYERASLELFEAGPFLVHLDRRSALLEALVREGWARAWGIFAEAPCTLAELRRHLRRYLMVELDAPRGRGYLRFYDPRALRALAPVLGRDERWRAFAGPMTRVVYEGADGLPVVRGPEATP